jgi:hypothetical protein
MAGLEEWLPLASASTETGLQTAQAGMLFEFDREGDRRGVALHSKCWISATAATERNGRTKKRSSGDFSVRPPEYRHLPFSLPGRGLTYLPLAPQEPVPQPL